ncbi:MAG: diguanylate cyclase [Proteobacteria bacterium]|nr:diguanylate cyclase [Pseudomonadota bacterium]
MSKKHSDSPLAEVMTSDRTMQIDRSIIDKQLRTTKTKNKKACFVILGGLDVGSIIEMASLQMTVGRDPNCDFVLRDDGISRVHIEVTRSGDDYVTVQDLGSTNGTFIQGEKVKRAMLKDGDKMLLGRRTVLKFVFQDELEQSYQRQMYESSTRDGLTGVYNRKYFAQKLSADLSFAHRHRIPFTLLMLDIDFFKKINDTYGHRTGDYVLIAVADMIQTTIRTEDALARYGGEEFAILAPGTDATGGHALAERIRAELSGHAVPAQNSVDQTIQVTVSIGVATLQPGVPFEADDLISVADKNLYQAKEGGRNQTVTSVIE